MVMDLTNIVAIIPARGGSKGIPNKNIIPLNGKPLIAWTIDASIKSGVVDRTIVSTDSDEIATISQKFGAETIKRPKHLAGDHASSESALLHSIDYLVKEGYDPDIIVFLQCTSPLRGPDIIIKGIGKIKTNDYDSIVSAFETTRYFALNRKGMFVPMKGSVKRRQDTEPWLCDSGAAYFIKKDSFMTVKDRYCGKIGFVPISEEDSLEIDTLDDFWLVEQILKKDKEKNRM